MAKATKSKKKPIDQYDHKGKRRVNNPPVGLVTPETDKETGKKKYAYDPHIDPPYGVSYKSNFQPFVGSREVREGKDEDLTQEPEMIKAFRDTWELGIHSYLSYLRDRLLLAKDLLTETGAIFVQISDENVHLVRNLLDEISGVENYVG
ncbi:MAG: DNA methyltransferase, partial [Candidatus Binatia bacterium]